METIIKTFNENPEKFLLTVSEKDFEVNGVIIGMVLSLPRPSLNLVQLYLKCLEKILVKYGQQLEPSYCFYKFYKIFNNLLREDYDVSHVFPIYVSVSHLLPNIPSKQNLKENISELFIQNFEFLIKKFSKQLEFVQVFFIGKSNKNIFEKLPMVLTEPISEHLTKLCENIDGDYECFLTGFKKLGQVMLSNQQQEKVFLVNFLYFITEKMILKPNLDFISFVAKNIQVLGRFMPADRIANIENLISLKKTEDNEKSEEKQKKQEDDLKVVNEITVQATESLPNIEKSGECSLKPKELKIEEKAQILSVSKRIENLIREAKEEYEFSNYLNLDIITIILEKQGLCFAEILSEIFPVFSRHLIDSLSPEEFSFWSMMLPSLQYIIEEEEYKTLSNMLKNCKPENEKNMRGVSNARQRPSTRRQFQSTALKRRTFIDSDENPYKDSTIISEYCPSSISQSFQSPEPSIQSESQNSESSNPQILCSFSDYFNNFTIHLQNIIEIYNSTSDAEEKTSLFFNLKQKIREKSPSAQTSLIGCFSLNVHILESLVQVSVVDFLSPCLEALVRSCMEPDSTFDSKSKILFISKKPVFEFIFNEELEIYNYELIRHYTCIEKRLKELIFVVKIWRKRYFIDKKEFPSDFQIILIAVVFFQNAEPPLLPKAQLLEHEPVIIAQFDVGFNCSFDFKTENFQSLGEIFKGFLMFLVGLSNGPYLADPKTGSVHSIAENYFFLPVLTPFEQKIVYYSMKDSESSKKFLNVVENTLKILDDRGDFSQNFLLE
jgi:hypothetical protein